MGARAAFPGHWDSIGFVGLCTRTAAARHAGQHNRHQTGGYQRGGPARDVDADPLERILVRIEPREVGATGDELRGAVDRSFNQHEKIAGFRGRVLVMHTRNDDLVSVSHAERLHAWANEPKELLVFERGDHNTILEANKEAYFAAVRTFI